MLGDEGWYLLLHHLADVALIALSDLNILPYQRAVSFMSFSKLMYGYFSMVYQLCDILALNIRVSAIMHKFVEI